MGGYKVLWRGKKERERDRGTEIERREEEREGKGRDCLFRKRMDRERKKKIGVTRSDCLRGKERSEIG